MNVRKRGLALLMCICMIFTLLPFSALADATTQDVVYGTYGDDGKWYEDKTLTAESSVKHYPAPGEASDSKANIDYSKTAVKNDDGSYNVTLTIKSKTSETPPGASAVVLVIDNSGSMGDHQRLAKAKAAAKKFVDDYGKSGSGRYIALVSFADLANKYNFGDGWTWDNWFPESVYWLDASNENNRGAINASIQKMRADGGTNLEQGLSTANDLFKDNAISKISRSNNKYVIALTDGKPTFSGIYLGILGNSPKLGNGIDCTEQICNATETTATTLKGNVNTLYTVCYGAENEGTYTGGLTVGEFLKQKIASPGEAYNATDSSDSLSKAFAKIYKSIEQGISSGFTVTDPMGEYVTLDESSITENGASVSGSTITWEPKNGTTVENTDGSKTTTYTLTYRVTLGEVPKDDTYPLNKDTTLKFMDGDTEKTLHFNVPGVYREAPKYTVTYQYDGDVPDGAQAQLPVDNTQYKKGDTVTVAGNPSVDGWTFSGWSVANDSPTKPIITNDQFNMPNGNVVLEGSWTKRTDLSYTVHHYLNGTTERAYPDETVSGQTFNTTVTVNPKEADANYTPVSTDAKQVIITTVTNENEVIFYYYKNVTLTAKSNTVTYNGEEQTVSSFTGAPEGADFSSITVGAQGTNAGTYPANFAGGTVGTVDATGKYIVTKAVNGNLIIKPAEVTITADNKEKFVDEADPEFTYTISGIVEADKDKKVTLTIIREKVGTPEGEQAGSYSIIPKDASIEGSNNYTFKYVNGTLTIKERNAIKVTLTAKKYLDGELAKTQFEFVLKDKDNIIIQTKYNNENGIVSFDQLTFAEAGNHIYYISEVAGDKTSINYDKTVYKVTVHVTLNAATGNYDSAVAYSKLLDDGAPAPTTNNEAVFNNTTKPTGSLTISKTVSGNAASTTKEFTFTVTLMQNGDTPNNEVTFGDVTFINGVATFKLKARDVKTITGIPAGFDYTVTESDNNGYTVTVNGQNTATATGKIMAGKTTEVAFNNHKSYVYPPNPPIMDEIIVEITGNSDSVVYDGTEHSVKGYTVKISDPRYTEKDFTFTGKAEASGVNAGTYEMGLKAEQFKNTNARFTNVKFVIKADGVLTITPKELIITAGSKTEYGPTPVTCDEWTVSGLAAGDKVESVKITGIQSVPGSSPNVPSDAVIKNAKGEDVTKNYAIKYVNGTLTMLEVLNKEDHFNYIIGTPEGLSLPTANVTRAEVATIFFRLMTDDARAKFDSLDNNFSDVAKGKWYNRAISTLAKAGIVKGDPAGTYRPGDPITRAEMAAIIARFGDFKEGGKTFNDISGHWAQKYIELAASNGWINGNPDGTFKPNNNITRAETVAMINRVLDRQTKDVSDLLPVSQMTNWSDNMDTAKWYYRDMQEATNNHKAERVGNSIYEKWTEKLPDIDWASYQI